MSRLKLPWKQKGRPPSHKSRAMSLQRNSGRESRLLPDSPGVHDCACGTCGPQIIIFQTFLFDSSIPSSITNYTMFYFLTSKSSPKDLWPLRHLIRVTRRHDLTKTILAGNEDFVASSGFISVTSRCAKYLECSAKEQKVIIQSRYNHSKPKLQGLKNVFDEAIKIVLDPKRPKSPKDTKGSCLLQWQHKLFVREERSYLYCLPNVH